MGLDLVMKHKEIVKEIIWNLLIKHEAKSQSMEENF